MHPTPGRFSDWPALARIIRKTLPLNAQERSFLIRRHYREFRVFRQDRRIVGFTFGSFDKRPGLAWLEQIAVAPEFQGRSLGKALLHDFEQHAQERGCEQVGLIVRRANRVARKLYESAGYRCEEIESNFADVAYFKTLSPNVGVSPHTERIEKPRQSGLVWRLTSHLLYRILTRAARDSFATK